MFVVIAGLAIYKSGTYINLGNYFWQLMGKDNYKPQSKKLRMKKKNK
jgi:hypothetical protein